MKTKQILFIIFILFMQNLYSQNPEWISYSSGKIIRATAIEGDSIWVGTNGGLVKLNKLTGETIFYNTSNSGLPGNDVRSIAIDESGNKWIGTYGGLAKYDGTNWEVYNTSNSGLPDNDVISIAIDESGNKWIGTYGGLAKYDGTNWEVYNTSNSGLPGNDVYSIAIDGSGNKWIGTYGGGLAKYDGTNWEVYNTSNSGLPDNYVYSIAIDGSGDKWIGTGYGLAKYDGTNWEVYNTSNSGLPDNDVISIAIDESGNKWIGTIGGGLAVFNEGGVVSVEDKKQTILPQNFLLSQNYPNPFNPTTSIEYSIPNVETLRATSQMQNVSLKVFDILGREVAELVNEQKSAGRYKVNFNASNLSSGVYLYQLKSGNHVSSMKMLLIK